MNNRNKETCMSKTNLLIIGLVLIAVSLSCKSFMPAKSADTSKGPAIDFTTPGKGLDVKVQLDKKQTASGKVTKAGGSVSLTAADGSKFTLGVPADALDAETTITMTAVTSIDGAPLDKNTPTAAVQLEPSGLFFKEMATLTIVPAKEIPIKEQIIFSYEDDGKDYHLAVVDHKSKEIKIKLMQFSGAGVGSGSDRAWAANLVIEARAAESRIFQKLGEYLQDERRKMLLGDDDSVDGDALAERMKSALDQFEDQVVLKEIVAAELDCKHAEKAAQDLLSLERQRQLAGLPGTPNLLEKLSKLSKIAKDCAKAFLVSGTSNNVSFTGQICSLDKPFVLNGTFGNGSETQSFTPSSATGGSVEESGNSGGCTQTGAGTYQVTLNDQGSGELQWTETVTASCPPYSSTKTYTFKLPLKPAPDLSCP